MGEERSAGTELLEDDTNSAYPEASIAERMQREEVRSALDSLDDRLRLVLQLRFGLAGQPPHTLVEVGQAIGRDARAGASTGGEGARRAAQPCAGSPCLSRGCVIRRGAGDMTWDTMQVKLELRPEAAPLPLLGATLSQLSPRTARTQPLAGRQKQNGCAPPLAGPPPHSANTLSASAFGLHTAGATLAVTSGAHAIGSILGPDQQAARSELAIPALEGRVSTPYICAAPLAHRDRTCTPRAAEQARD